MENLETWSKVFGMAGIFTTIFFAFMAYRKKLLNTGFTNWGNRYRIEMDEFKNEVFRYINTFREILNKNEEGHRVALRKIVDLNLETQRQVQEQIGECRIIQGRKDVITKSERDWKSKMEKQQGDIYDDVEEMKKSIAYIKGKMNGKV